MQTPPYPLIVLNAYKTTVLANVAMGRLLGIEDGVEETISDDGNGPLERLRGQTLNELGIDMLQDGRPVWVTWESFLDGLAGELGSHMEDNTYHQSSEYDECDVTPTAERAEPLSRRPSLTKTSTVHDAVVEVVITQSFTVSSGIKCADAEKGKHTFAKMIITIWEIYDEKYFTLAFTSTDSSQTSLPSSRGQSRQVPKAPKHYSVGSAGSSTRSSPSSISSGQSSNHGSSSNSSAITSPTSAPMSGSPFPLLGPPIKSTISSSPSSLQKKGESLTVPNKAARRLFHSQIDVSTVRYDYTGLNEEDSLGMGWKLPFHPDDMAAMGRRWVHSLATGDPYSTEYRCLSKHGDWRWIFMKRFNHNLLQEERQINSMNSNSFAELTKLQRQQLLSVIAHAQATLFSVDRNRNLTLLEGAFIWDLESEFGSGDESSGSRPKGEDYIGKNVYDVFFQTTHRQELELQMQEKENTRLLANEAAENYAMKALAIREQYLDKDDPEVGNSYSNYAHNLFDQGKYDEAQMYYEKALALHQASEIPFDDLLEGAYTSLANNLIQLGGLKKRNWRSSMLSRIMEHKFWDEAEDLIRRYLSLRLSILGIDHRLVSVTQHHLAFLYVKRDEAAEAITLLRSAITIFRVPAQTQRGLASRPMFKLASVLLLDTEHSKRKDAIQKVLTLQEAKEICQKDPLLATLPTDTEEDWEKLVRVGHFPKNNISITLENLVNVAELIEILYAFLYIRS
ncbi:hypothetical protein G7Y89_g2948 [Cudoniella acicularis]|uniref:PAS fold-3 domain-containing protein n=1 Tax=Cudoniella acicularis TaxID=354080 RepID=A0A8H4RUA3_9HELO|nr:hypothetical protein G7Y89_g2948 [Cudoniella acicularis]